MAAHSSEAFPFPSSLDSTPSRAGAFGSSVSQSLGLGYLGIAQFAALLFSAFLGPTFP